MKFCAVLPKYPKDVPGGAEFQAYLICRELSARGHETHYVAHQSDRTDTVEDEGIDVHRLNQSGSSEIISTLKDVDADTCYFRIAQDLPLLWRAKRKLEADFVYNVSRDVQCQSLLSGGPYEESNSFLKDILNRGRYAVYRYLLKVPDQLFAQSRQQQLLLRKNNSLESTLIGNGHPVPEPDFKKESPPVVLWLASLKKVKNPGTFISLFERAKDLPCQFWIVGRPVDDEIHEMVKEKVSEHEKLEYLGGCGILESNKFFKKAAVYVHTGDSEGFPNTFIQSWLHGTPVISFCADPDSVIEKNEIGTHCDSLGEAESSLRQLIMDPNYRSDVGDNARKYGIENHSIEVICDKIERSIEGTKVTNSKDRAEI